VLRLAGASSTLGVGAGATQRADIAVTIVGGQTLCLFLTLLLVPVSYSLAEEAAERALDASAFGRLECWGTLA